MTHAADRYFSVAGARLRYRDEGRGPALVLLHGWTLDLTMWDPQVRLLRGQLRLIRLDRRGHGLSGGTAAGGRDADDVAALLRHLNVGEVALLGMSQGVRGALAFAGAWPQRVRALILDGPPRLQPGEAEEQDVPLIHYRALVRSQGIEAFRREWLRHPLMQLHGAATDAKVLLARMVERYAGSDLGAEPARGAPGTGRATAAAPAALERIPTLIVTGERDLPGRIRHADELARRLPGAQRRIVRGAGHLSNLDRPLLYSELCRAFLLRQPVTPATA